MYLLVPMSHTSAEFSEMDALGLGLSLPNDDDDNNNDDDELGLSPPNDDDDNNSSTIYHTVLGSHCVVVIWSPCSAVCCTLKKLSSYSSNAYPNVFSLPESIGISCFPVCSLPLSC